MVFVERLDGLELLKLLLVPSLLLQIIVLGSEVNFLLFGKSIR